MPFSSRTGRLAVVLTVVLLAGAMTPSSLESSAPPPAVAGERPWGLQEDRLRKLAERAEVYRDYVIRFTCDESVRLARYDGAAQSQKETRRQYAYLLERSEDGRSFRELRQKVRADGTVGSSLVKDEESFPPAYAWVFLFSAQNQPYFSYREVGDRFEGYDWVVEIEFKGAVPFSDGRDIRQWEGSVLLDATSLTPVRIDARPTNQDRRIRAEFARWQQAFNLIGFRLAPRPFGYRCRVDFVLRKDRLTFPTRLRHETFRMVTSKTSATWSISTRSYEDYRFFKTAATESPAEPGSN